MAKRTTYGKAAAQLVAQRVDLVDAAGKALEEVHRLEAEYAERLAAAREHYAQRYREALAGGWSAGQLGEVDLPAPDGVRGSRRKSRRTPAADASASGRATVAVPGTTPEAAAQQPDTGYVPAPRPESGPDTGYPPAEG